MLSVLVECVFGKNARFERCARTNWRAAATLPNLRGWSAATPPQRTPESGDDVGGMSTFSMSVQGR